MLRESEPLALENAKGDMTLQSRLRNRILALLGAVALATGCSEALVTLEDQGPGAHHKVSLVDYQGIISLDRNFDLKVDGSIIYHSPDEGPPAERVIWSQDGQRFLLLGKHLLTKDGWELKDGHQLYLMYDISSRKLWCNTSQRPEQPVPLDELRATRWSEKLPEFRKD